jgi:hypothetical protein
VETLATTEAFRPNSGYFGALLGCTAIVVGKIIINPPETEVERERIAEPTAPDRLRPFV